jgi:predicted  nucleic acid-binding Zn-ribbon protein
MGKPVNIASTSHSQQAELAVLLGGGRQAAPVSEDVEALTEALREAEAANAGLTTALNEAQARVVELDTALQAEREAHAKTQAALTAATTASTGE